LTLQTADAHCKIPPTTSSPKGFPTISRRDGQTGSIAPQNSPSPFPAPFNLRQRENRSCRKTR
jgi:hypothetical protein